MRDDPSYFFRPEGDAYLPQPNCRGPWDEGSLHGRVVAGLLAFAIETQHRDDAFMPARLTVDLYRLPDFSPMTVATRVIRDGRRIKVIDAEVFSAGKSVGRASCQLLARTANSQGKVWSPANWDAPLPGELSPPAHQGFGVWDTRPITPFMATQANKRAWMREIHDLVEDMPITALGAFGLPTFFVDEQMFFGNHRVDFVEEPWLGQLDMRLREVPNFTQRRPQR